MKMFGLAAALFSVALPALAHSDTAPINCTNCKEWNAPQKPFKVYGNTWYVGTHGLTSVLVTSAQGHILVDGALPQSAEQIAANIEALGFKLHDVKFIVNSHAHWDHAGGIAALARMTGATVLNSPSGAWAMEHGTSPKDDPQYEAKNPDRIPKVKKVKLIADGDVVKTGPLALTAHFTPGHTPGGITWSWQSCDNGACKDIVFAESLNPISSDSFRYTGGGGQPDVSARFRASIAKVDALKCDIILSGHPGVTDTFERLAAGNFATPGACHEFAAAGVKLLDKRLAGEHK
ncbi:MAG: subclass B3 metallo-beta-lactamase [Pseudomonadota bacterium]